MIDRSKFNDMIIFHVGEDKVPIKLHAAAVRTKSKYVECLFAENPEPADGRVIELPGVTCKTFELFCEWMTKPHLTIKVPEATGLYFHLIDAFVLAVKLKSTSFYQRMLKLFVAAWKKHHTLPTVLSIKKIYDPDRNQPSGSGLRKLVVDLLVWESEADWLYENDWELEETKAGRRFLKDFTRREHGLVSYACKKGEGPFLKDLTSYHVDKFDVIA